MQRHHLSRRGFLTASIAGSVLLATRNREALAAPPGDTLWVQIMANGGWDQAMFTDPKQGLRDYGAATLQSAGAIPFMNFPEISGFFAAHHPGLLVFQGVDTSTNNHDAGVRVSLSGSLLEGFPIFAAQVAAARGADRLLPMFTLYDYNETGGLVAPNPIDYTSASTFGDLKDVNRPPSVYSNEGAGSVSSSSGVFLPKVAPRSAPRRSRRAHRAAARPGDPCRATGRASSGFWRPGRPVSACPSSTSRPRGSSSRPGSRESRRSARPWPSGPGASRRSRRGLSASLVVGLGGNLFDTHAGHPDSEQLGYLGQVLALAGFLLDHAQTQGVPTCVVLCSDFGRTPEREGSSGTGHWPISTLMIAQNKAALAQGKLPGNLVVGGTTGEAAAPNPDPKKALLARKINPSTLAFSDTGVVPTPAHIYRVLRRSAGIEEATVLRDFKLNIEEGDGPFALVRRGDGSRKGGPSASQTSKAAASAASAHAGVLAEAPGVTGRGASRARPRQDRKKPCLARATPRGRARRRAPRRESPKISSDGWLRRARAERTASCPLRSTRRCARS
jgi:hypothetical protein